MSTNAVKSQETVSLWISTFPDYVKFKYSNFKRPTKGTSVH